MLDVDECEEELDSCEEQLEECRNTIGGYECDVICQQGFFYSIQYRSCIGNINNACTDIL